MKTIFKIKNILILLLITYSVFSQNEVVKEDAVIQENLKDKFRFGGGNLGSGSNGILYGFDNSKVELIGNAYFSIDPLKSNIKFFPKNMITVHGDAVLDTASNIPCKYNMLDNLMEMEVNGEVKAIDANMIKKIKMGNAVFVNINNFGRLELKDGLIEELIGGDFGLYAQYHIVLKQPTYNAAMNSGSKDRKILKERKLLIRSGRNLYEVKNKKIFEEVLGVQYAVANEFMKENKKSYKNEADLISLLEYLNKN